MGDPGIGNSYIECGGALKASRIPHYKGLCRPYCDFGLQGELVTLTFKRNRLSVNSHQWIVHSTEDRYLQVAQGKVSVEHTQPAAVGIQLNRAPSPIQ